MYNYVLKKTDNILVEILLGVKNLLEIIANWNCQYLVMTRRLWKNVKNEKMRDFFSATYFCLRFDIHFLLSSNENISEFFKR